MLRFNGIETYIAEEDADRLIAESAFSKCKDGYLTVVTYIDTDVLILLLSESKYTNLYLIQPDNSKKSRLSLRCQKSPK